MPPDWALLPIGGVSCLLESLPVYGGVPEGSILGVLLFNISTDDVEDEVRSDNREFALDELHDNSPESVGSSENLDRSTPPKLNATAVSTSPDISRSKCLPSTTSWTSEESGEPSSSPVEALASGGLTAGGHSHFIQHDTQSTPGRGVEIDPVHQSIVMDQTSNTAPGRRGRPLL